MDRALPLLFMALLAAGCGNDAPAGGDAAPEPVTPPPDARVVVLRDEALRLEPDPASPGFVEVPAGLLLAVVDDSAAPGWTRVATWDDRRGWLPDSLVVPVELWAHYAEALGGVSPVLLRPAYPLAGHWAIEAPFDSPGFTAASTAWLIDDSASAVRVTAIDTFGNPCGDDRYRFAVTERRAPGDEWPALDAGVLTAPSGGRPPARRLPIGVLEPGEDLAALAERAAAALAPSAGPPASVEWRSLGADAAWASFSWPYEDVDLGLAQRAAAALFVRSGPEWRPAGVLPVAAASAEIPTPAWRPVAAYATGAEGRGTLLLLEALEFEGARLEIWIERGGRFVRLHEGYYWGC